MASGIDSLLLEVVDDGEAGFVDVAAGDGFVVSGGVQGTGP